MLFIKYSISTAQCLITIKHCCFAVFCLLLFSCKKTKKVNQPKDTIMHQKSVIIGTEVTAFWEAFNEKKLAKRNELLTAYVLDSTHHPAVNTMYKMTLGKPAYFINRIEKYNRYYKSMQQHSLEMVHKKYPEIDTHYTAFKKIYPKAHRPKIIFTVGALTVGGSITDEGLIIGTEFYGQQQADTVGMGRMANHLLTTADFTPLMFHEHMHYEQLKIAGSKEKLFSPKRTLLSLALNEGAADFVSNLITQWYDTKANYIYGRMHEQALWEQFKKDMHSEETIINWMYDFGIEKDTPPDLGYFMGAKICESYYINQPDKAQAIEDILSITNPDDFLKKSGYEKKFSKYN
jgi:hypothetical protein